MLAFNSPGHAIGAQLDGGEGNDTLQSGVLLTNGSSSVDSVDTLTGGDGFDEFRIDVDFGNAPDASDLTESKDHGIVAQIADFVSGDDILVFPEPAVGNETTVEFLKAEDASFTDVVLTTTARGSANFLTFTVRLEGTANLTSSDVILTTDRFDTHDVNLVNIDQNQYA